VASFSERVSQPFVVPLPVLGNDTPHRVVRVFEFRGGVDEGTAAEVPAPDHGDDVITNCAQKLSAPRTLGQLFHPLRFEIVSCLQVRDHQILLARKVAVEGRQRHLARRNDAIDAHLVDSLGVEQTRRRGEQPFSSLRTLSGPFVGCGRHLRSVEIERWFLTYDLEHGFLTQ
jgi:hypothetical protein